MSSEKWGWTDCLPSSGLGAVVAWLALSHSGILAWRILWTEEPGGLPSMGSHRVGHG